MTEFNPFEMDDEPEAPAPADEVTKKRGRKKKAYASDSDPNVGKKHIGGYFPKPVSTELKRVCIEREEKTGREHSIQGLLAEGINHVLRQAGRQAIAKES